MTQSNIDKIEPPQTPGCVEGIRLIRNTNDIIAEQIAQAAYFFMSAGIARNENVPDGDVDAYYLARLFIKFGSHHESLGQAIQGKFIDDRWPVFQSSASLHQVEAGLAVCCSVQDERVKSCLQLFLICLEQMLNSGDLPSIPLDFRFLCTIAIQSITPIEETEAILAGGDFRDL